MNTNHLSSRTKAAGFKRQNLAHFRKKILVLSNKGGVGKSTMSVNIACGLRAKQFTVGILDADIHGPSVNKMLDIENVRVSLNTEGHPVPICVTENLYALSSASLLESPDQPLIWRGPMKMKLLSQFLEDFEWPPLDFMVIDCPPGTGDEPMSVIQLFEGVDYAVIVITPQEVALLDVKKGINFLKKMDVLNIGVIENMSGFVCPHCRKEIDIFKKGSVKAMAADFDIDFLGSVPIEMNIVASSDRGKAYLSEFAEEPSAKALSGIIDRIQNAAETSRSSE